MKMKIRFSSEEEATLTKLVLDVDTELQPLKIERSTSVDDRMLFIHINVKETKLLRVALNSIEDMVALVSQSILEFHDASTV